MSLQIGDLGRFARLCTPQHCALNRRGRLPNAELWEWYLEIMEWPKQDLGGLLVEVMKDVSVWHVRAFIAFKNALASGAVPDGSEA